MVVVTANDSVSCVYLVLAHLTLISVNVEDYALTGVNEVCYVSDTVTDVECAAVSESTAVV